MPALTTIHNGAVLAASLPTPNGTSPPMALYLDDDSYIASLETRLHRLAVQKTQFEHELQTLQAVRFLTLNTLPPYSLETPTLPSNPYVSLARQQPSPYSFASTVPDPPSLASDEAILALALSRTTALTAHTLTRLHRLAGVTTFISSDADTNSELSQQLLGVRIELFSQATKTFGTPVYFFLRLIPANKGGLNLPAHFVLVRHSSPAFLGAAKLADKLLAKPGKTLMGGDDSGQRIDEFVKEIRARLHRWRRRTETVEGVREAAKGAARVGDMNEGWERRVDSVDWDMEVARLWIRWSNGVTAEGVVVDSGKVVKCVCKDRKGGRRRDVEHQVVGTLEGIPDRVGWL